MGYDTPYLFPQAIGYWTIEQKTGLGLNVELVISCNRGMNDPSDIKSCRLGSEGLTDGVTVVQYSVICPNFGTRA